MTQRSRYGEHPGSRRRAQLRTRRIAAAAVCALLLAAVVGGVFGIVNHVKKTREAERIAQLEAEERARIEAEVAAVDQVFAENIYLDGELISGRSYDSVLSDYTARYDQRLQNSVTIRFNGAQWSFSAATVGGTTDVKDRVDEAWKYAHEGDTDQRYADMQKLKTESVELNVSLVYDREALEQYAQSLKDSVDADPVDATMTVVKEGQADITDSMIGYDLNLEETEALLVKAVEQGATEDIDLLPQVIEPEVTEEKLAYTYQRLTRYSTSFQGSTINRAANIQMCLRRFNGMEIQPGQQVSFNDVVGPRTLGRGFRQAVEYVNGNKENDVGGGTCQASTTLYGAVLRAGLQINERLNHSLPVSYVPPSQDAAVSSSGKDLVFTNNTSGVIYIYTGINKERMTATVTIYGTPVKSNTRIEIQSEVTQPDIEAKPKYIKDYEGEYVWYADEAPVLKSKGQLGYRSQAYRVYYNATTGEEMRRDLLSTDYYAPIAAEYYVGVH